MRPKSNRLSYSSWEHMIQRCLNPHNDNYKNYGGRGITVCEKWRKYDGFFEDMGERAKHESIERLNVNDGYYKENCVWINKKLQGKNTTKSLRFEINGQSIVSVPSLSLLTGIPDRSIRYRLRKKWDLQDVVGLPVGSRSKTIYQVNGLVFPTLVAVAKYYGINIKTLRSRMEFQGLSLLDAINYVCPRSYSK